ncbi:MAG: hypothetical protein WB660_29155, partial [Candidatus Sulfotelmatobacter sp.]
MLREPARILTALGNKKDNRWLQLAQRWIVQYNFYVNDRHWGRMFVRLSPYFPFSARVCLNQHHWLALRMQQENLDFQQTTNAFLRCRDPQRLQELADSLTAHDLLVCGRKWLNGFTPFFTEKERKHAGCQHRLFFAQVEYSRSVPWNKFAIMCPPQICGVGVGTPGSVRGRAESRAHLRDESAYSDASHA